MTTLNSLNRKEVIVGKAAIVNLLETNDKAIAKALVILRKRQAADERNFMTTGKTSGQGFQPAHSRIGALSAAYVEKNGKLKPDQLAYWRQKNKKGEPKIGRYWKQLLSEADIDRNKGLIIL
jgi:phosphate uptake regulator